MYIEYRIGAHRYGQQPAADGQNRRQSTARDTLSVVITRSPKLLAISDLHVRYDENRAIVEQLAPTMDDDWLIVAGDVAETVSDVEWALQTLAGRFSKVIWVPGNHELWTTPDDSVQLRGEERYEYLVQLCRTLGVVTPQDPYPVWTSPAGPVTVAPLFLLYDYTFRPPGTRTKEEGLQAAYSSGVVCTDEYLLHPDPYPSRDAWCRQRVEYSRQRLGQLNGASTVLVNHWPLTRESTNILRFPEFALWCGTELTAGWHLDYHATAVVYGHLHIPRTTEDSGVRFEEVSVGYPREWQARKRRVDWPRIVLPEGGTA